MAFRFTLTKQIYAGTERACSMRAVWPKPLARLGKAATPISTRQARKPVACGLLSGVGSRRSEIAFNN